MGQQSPAPVARKRGAAEELWARVAEAGLAMAAPGPVASDLVQSEQVAPEQV
jgi:hypothetical protein